jgi:DNA polymerase-3 subunit gamma/tau
MFEEFLGQPNKEKIYELLEKVGSSDAAAALVCLDALLSSGTSCIGVLDGLVESFRDMMVLKASVGGSSSLVILTQAEKIALSRIAEVFDIPALVYNVTLLEKLRWPVKNSDNPRALLEAALLRLALSEHFMSIPELLSQAGGVKAVKNTSAGSKKNTVAADSTPSPPKKQPETKVEHTQQEPVIASDADIEQIKQHWGKIVDFARLHANARIAELLKKAVPLRLNGGTLSIGFDTSDEFSMKLCQSNGRAEIIESVLSSALGTKIKAVFETIDNGGRAGQKPKPPGAKASKKTIDEAANTPAVRTILSELDANILDVKEEGQ